MVKVKRRAGSALVRKYADGSDALEVGGEVVSVNLSAHGLVAAPGEVFIRNYGPDEGLIGRLVDLGVVRSFRAVTFGPFDVPGVRAKLAAHLPREEEA